MKSDQFLVNILCSFSVLMLFFSTGKAFGEEEVSLKFEGTPGVSFFGICSSVDPAQEKKIEGVTPKEVSMDIRFSKCKVQKKSEQGELSLRVFQGRKMLSHHKDIPPTAGIEFVIPLGAD